jgi:hypothetical protein
VPAWARKVCRIVKEPYKSTRPTLRVGARTSAFVSVGSEGLEPSPGGLRVRCAAASTLIPFFLFTTTHNGRGGNRTLDPVLIRDLLSPLSYAPSVGSKGLEPSPAGLKVRCAAVTPRPQMSVGRMRFHRVLFMLLLFISSGSPESRTQRHPVISRVWATGPRLPCANVVVCQVGMAGLEPASPCSQRPCCARCPVDSPLPYIPLLFPVRTGGIEPPISWPPTRCAGTRARYPFLRYVLFSVTRTGVEPVLPPTNLRSVPEGRCP